MHQRLAANARTRHELGERDGISASELADVQRAAIAWGARETCATRDAELLATPTELLSSALQRLPDLAVVALVVQALMHDADPRLSRMAAKMQGQSAGILRLCQRALEVHSRNVGYQLEAWNARAIDYAACLLGDGPKASCPDSPTGEVRLVVYALGQAIVACENDRMAVPELLSEASACVLVLFILARDLARFTDHVD